MYFSKACEVEGDCIFFRKDSISLIHGLVGMCLLLLNVFVALTGRNNFRYFELIGQKAFLS